jgi:serine phosphatase RsbU (regulator of sigma subunit)
MPYSQEDLALLASVANQAGLALQSIQLAEDITQRMEAERRAAVEMKIALEVQSNLFPKSPPPLRTLEYAGSCAQARTVGGDYYDFLQLSPGRVALVLADVAGKGISAALLMSNLQANLRSHSAMAEQDLLSFLSLLNRRFLDAAKGERFVTLFMGIYDDATRSLLIANCGHNAPFLLRRDGSLEKLHATATVMGLFEPWPCECKTLEIAPGDTLVVYSDGVTDAASDDGEMFGDIRLEELIRRCAKLPVSQMLEAMAREVQVFSGTDAEDDLTLLIARGR